MFQEKFVRTLKAAIVGNFHTSEYALTLWFVYAYGFVYLLGNYTISVLKKKEYILIFALVMGYMGSHVLAQMYGHHKQQIFNLSAQVLTGMMFYLIGYVLKNKISEIKYHIIFLMIGLYYFIKYQVFTESTMSWSKYPNDFVVFVFCTLVLCSLIFWIAKWVSYLPISGFFSLVGRHSKIIMSYHLLTFLFLDLFFYQPNMIIKVFPDINKSVNMAILYSIAGVLLPLLIGILYDYLNKLIKPKFSNFKLWSFYKNGA